MYRPVTSGLLKETEGLLTAYEVDGELEGIDKCLDSPWECGKYKIANRIVSTVICSWERSAAFYFSPMSKWEYDILLWKTCFLVINLKI